MTEMKMKLAQAALTSACSALGLQSDVEVLTIKHETVWILTYDQDPNKPHFGNAMIKLERFIKEMLGEQVELQLEPSEDRNKRFQRTGRKLQTEVLRGVESI